MSPEEGGLLRQIQRMLNVEMVMDVVEGIAPSKPIRLDTPIPKNGGGQRQPGGQPPRQAGASPARQAGRAPRTPMPAPERSGAQAAQAGVATRA